MSLKKLAVATVLIGGGVAAANYTSAFDNLFPGSTQESIQAPAQEVIAETDQDQQHKSLLPRETMTPEATVSEVAGANREVTENDVAPKTLAPKTLKESAKDRKGEGPLTDENDLAAAQETTQNRQEPWELAGKWRVIRALRDGAAVPFDRSAAMTVEFDVGKIIIASGSKQEVGMLSAEHTRMIGESSFAEVVISPTEQDKGDKKQIRGFYYHEEGELTLIWGAPGADRPDPTNQQDFASARILTLEAAQ